MLWRATLSAGHCHLNLTAICGNWSGSICSGSGGGFAQGLGKICRFRTGFGRWRQQREYLQRSGRRLRARSGKICRFRTGFRPVAATAGICSGSRSGFAQVKSAASDGFSAGGGNSGVSAVSSGGGFCARSGKICRFRDGFSRWRQLRRAAVWLLACTSAGLSRLASGLLHWPALAPG